MSAQCAQVFTKAAVLRLGFGMGLPQFLDSKLLSLGSLPGAGQFLLCVMPMIAIPLAEELTQLCLSRTILIRPLCLPFESLQTRLKFRQDVEDTIQIMAGGLSTIPCAPRLC